MDESRHAWCQLVCTTDINAPILYISADSFTIGRSKGCDLCISDNQHISGRHCCIFKDSDDEVWLQDNSTNDTLINMETKISKGQNCRLKHGDEIHVVHKKNNPGSNVAYLYQNTAELQKELDSSDSDLQKTDCTLEYDISACAEASPDRGPEEEQVPVVSPAVKRIRLDNSALGFQEAEQELMTTGLVTDVEPAVITSSEQDTTRVASGESKSGEQDTSVIASGEKPSSEQATAGVTSGEQTCGKDSKAGPSTVKARDDMEETLLCSICQDILHNAVSLQPCMHTFCAACYSSWMTKSKECPSCRNKVDRISYNHIVKNLVEVYLKEHPDKRRSDEEIKEMDAQNKISNDMLQPRGRNNESIDYLAGSDSYSSSDSDTSSSSLNIGFTPMSIFGRLPLRSTCRQCVVPRPNFGIQLAANTPITISTSNILCTTTGAKAIPTTAAAVGCKGIAASTSTSALPTRAQACAQRRVTPSGQLVPMPTPPQYSCAANANHLACMCCMDHMPDRRGDRGIVTDLPPQSCCHCNRYFCHMYWGCSKPTCLGCLNQLKDLQFSQDCTNTLVNNNQYESEILMNYIQSKNITYLDLFQECLVRMDSNRYKPASQTHRQTSSSSVFCYMCGLTLFKELAYLYRKDIPRNELPNDVIRRPDCYWGNHCRTQVNKPHHARNFNHICEQTRH